jgi:hypothetical protein
MAKIHIDGRRWFQRTYGNTYHSVRIYVDGEVTTLPRQYGYGDQYLQTAWDWLQSHGYIPSGVEYGGTRYLREELGATYSVADVARQSDL